MTLHLGVNPQTLRIIAVDPGLTGALAHLSLDRATLTVRLDRVTDMPLLPPAAPKSKPRLDVDGLGRAIRYGVPPDLVVIEDVGAAPGQGVTSMFTFGYGAGAVAGAAAALGHPIQLVRPQKWQKWARLRPGARASQDRASQLFPAHAGLFKRATDHGRSDAVLIGYAALSEIFAAVLSTA